MRVSGADFFFFYGDKSPLLQVQLFRHKQRARTNFSGVVGVRTFTSSCRLPAPARHEVSTLSFALRVCCFCRKSRIAGLTFCFSRLALLFKAPGFALIPCPPFLPLPRLLTCSTPFPPVCCRVLPSLSVFFLRLLLSFVGVLHPPGTMHRRWRAKTVVAATVGLFAKINLWLCGDEISFVFSLFWMPALRFGRPVFLFLRPRPVVGHSASLKRVCARLGSGVGGRLLPCFTG